MNFKANLFVSLAVTLILMGCQGPVATHVTSHPIMFGADAHSVQVGDKIWLELTIPHEANSEQWVASFDDKMPEDFQVENDATKTKFKWVVIPDKIKFFGLPGYKFNIKNSKEKHNMGITVRPNYSVVLGFIGGAIH